MLCALGESATPLSFTNRVRAAPPPPRCLKRSGGHNMASLLLLTPASDGSAQVLPSLGLLGHVVRVLPLDAAPLLDAPPSDVVLVDARREMSSARATCRLL